MKRLILFLCMSIVGAELLAQQPTQQRAPIYFKDTTTTLYYPVQYLKIRDTLKAYIERVIVGDLFGVAQVVRGVGKSADASIYSSVAAVSKDNDTLMAGVYAYANGVVKLKAVSGIILGPGTGTTGGGGGGGAVSSVFGRTGAVTAVTGDYSSFYLRNLDTASGAGSRQIATWEYVRLNGAGSGVSSVTGSLGVISIPPTGAVKVRLDKSGIDSLVTGKVRNMASSDSLWWWNKRDTASTPGVPTINRMLDSLGDLRTTINTKQATIANLADTSKYLESVDSTLFATVNRTLDSLSDIRTSMNSLGGGGAVSSVTGSLGVISIPPTGAVKVRLDKSGIDSLVTGKVRNMASSDSLWWWNKRDTASTPGVPTINRMLDSLGDLRTTINTKQATIANLADTSKYVQYPDTTTGALVASASKSGFLKYSDWAKFNANTAINFKWNVTGQAQQTDSLRFIQGTNMTVTQSGNTVTLASSGGSSGSSWWEIDGNGNMMPRKSGGESDTYWEIDPQGNLRSKAW